MNRKATEEEKVLADKENIRVPLMLMDGEALSVDRDTGSAAVRSSASVVDAFGLPAGHRPGYCFSTDPSYAERKAEAYEAHRKTLTNAWRDGRSLEDTKASTEEARKAYETWLVNAWRAR